MIPFVNDHSSQAFRFPSLDAAIFHTGVNTTAPISRAITQAPSTVDELQCQSSDPPCGLHPYFSSFEYSG